MSRHRDEEYTRLLNSTNWRRLRLRLLREHPLCSKCEREGRVTAATEVHHIRPVERGSNIKEKALLAYDPDNLETLCHACHVETHRQGGKSTKTENRQRQREKAKSFNKKYISGRPPGGIFLTKGEGV